MRQDAMRAMVRGILTERSDHAAMRLRPFIIVTAFALTLVVVLLQSIGVSDFGSDTASIAILIGTLAFAQRLDRRSGVIVSLLAGAIAAIVPGVPSFPPHSLWEFALRFSAFMVMAVVYSQVITALRDRDERVQRQLDNLRLLQGEVRTLHAMAIQMPVGRTEIDAQIAQAACRLVRGRRSRLVRKQPDAGEGAVIAQWPSAAWGDRDGDALDAVTAPLDTGYFMTRTIAGKEYITVPLARDQAFAATLQVECREDDRTKEENAELLAVYAGDASLTLEHIALREQLDRLVRAEERGRIARELHDGLVQSLGGIAFRMEYFSDILAPDNVDTVRQDLDATSEAVRKALKEARLMIHNLRAVTPSGDVCARLRTTVDDVARETGMNVAMELPTTAPMLLPTEADTICLVAREALQNVAKHARVEAASVTLRTGANGIEVTIGDDGRGFDDHGDAGERSLQYGILGMVERAAHHGGAVTIQTEPGRGTRVTLTLPAEEVPE